MKKILAVLSAIALLIIVVRLAIPWCCLLPVLLGAGAAGASLFYERVRPLFMVIAFILLGREFYLAYRKRLKEAPVCCHNTKIKLGKTNKIMVWMVAVVVIGLLFFPNYAPLLGIKREEKANIKIKTNKDGCKEHSGKKCDFNKKGCDEREKDKLE